MLTSFAHALHAAGYVASMRAKTSEVPLAIKHYHELESVAHIINDPTLLDTALTYQGDMHRRLGDIQKAITHIAYHLTETRQSIETLCYNRTMQR